MAVTLELQQIDIQPGQHLILFGNLQIIEGILQFLQESEIRGASAARRGFRQWVRAQLSRSY